MEDHLMYKRVSVRASKIELAAMIVCLLGILFILPQPGEAKGKKTEILVGANVPLTGGLSSVGMEQKWAYQTAVDDVNQAGGVFVKEYDEKLPVRLIIADDETDPGKASAAVERLIKIKKVDLMLGGFGAALGVIPGCIAAEKHRRLYHCSMCVFPPWHENNFKYSTLMFFELEQMGRAPFEVWDSLPPEKRPKNPALVLEDTFDGRAFRDAFTVQGKKLGYEFVLDIAAPVGCKDYSPQIIKAKSMAVDAIIAFGSGADIITFVRQCKENDFSVPFLYAVRGALDEEFWKALGKDANYIFCDGHWSMDYPYPGAKELGERFYDAFKKRSVTIGPLYALGQTLFQAIEKAGTLDSLKVREALLQNEFMTVMGKVKYNQYGFASYPAPMFQWMEGKQMTVYPFELTDYKPKLAPPWNER